MPYAEGLGRVFNVVPLASGVHIPLTNSQAVSFVVHLAAGSQAITLKESINGGSEANLPVLARLYKGPGAGGTWTAVPQDPRVAAYTHADATNNAIVFTVGAEQLSDGFNCIEVTSATATTCTAIVHDIKIQRDPALLASSLTG